MPALHRGEERAVGGGSFLLPAGAELQMEQALKALLLQKFQCGLSLSQCQWGK